MAEEENIDIEDSAASLEDVTDISKEEASL